MNENQQEEEMSLEEFIALPDTIPLIARDGFLASQAFREEFGVRVGSHLIADYFVNYVDRAGMENIAAAVGGNIISMNPVVMGLMDVQNLAAAGITQVQRQPLLDLKGRGTLVGFVDTGIDYTNDAFIYEDGSSKIQYIWDQTIAGNAPTGFYFGSEYTMDQLTEALRTENPYARVPQRDTVGHGTFLASLAASRESGEYIGAAPEAEIIAVKLKKANPFYLEQQLVPERQDNVFLSSDLMLGVQYILNKAAELGRPVAICIALGTNLTGHDGFSLMEEYLTRVSNRKGVAITSAAGNESQAGHHASGRITASGETQNIELISGELKDDIHLTMWTGATDRMAVSVTSPTGEVIPRAAVRSGSSYSTNLVLERSTVKIQYFFPVRGSGDQLTIIKIIRPTPGIWTITVYGEEILNGRYHFWLPVTGLIDPRTVFLIPNPNTTVVSPATAVGINACGAYDSLNNALYINSSWGNTRLPRNAPSFVAPGVNVGGLYPTGPGRMSGTSVAAAIVAGGAALLLQWGIVDGNDPALTSIRIGANMIRGCVRDASVNYPNPQWGYGKFNLYNTLSTIRT